MTIFKVSGSSPFPDKLCETEERAFVELEKAIVGCIERGWHLHRRTHVDGPWQECDGVRIRRVIHRVDLKREYFKELYSDNIGPGVPWRSYAIEEIPVLP